MIGILISTQCVNYQRCGGNVTLLSGRSTTGDTRRGQQGWATVELVGCTCACSYSDEDVIWFGNEVAAGRAHP